MKFEIEKSFNLFLCARKFITCFIIKTARRSTDKQARPVCQTTRNQMTELQVSSVSIAEILKRTTKRAENKIRLFSTKWPYFWLAYLVRRCIVSDQGTSFNVKLPITIHCLAGSVSICNSQKVHRIFSED